MIPIIMLHHEIIEIIESHAYIRQATIVVRRGVAPAAIIFQDIFEDILGFCADVIVKYPARLECRQRRVDFHHSTALRWPHELHLLGLFEVIREDRGGGAQQALECVVSLRQRCPRDVRMVCAGRSAPATGHCGACRKQHTHNEPDAARAQQLTKCTVCSKFRLN